MTTGYPPLAHPIRPTTASPNRPLRIVTPEASCTSTACSAQWFQTIAAQRLACRNRPSFRTLERHLQRTLRDLGKGSRWMAADHSSSLTTTSASLGRWGYSAQRGDSNAGGDGPGTEQGRSRDGAGSVPQRVTSPIRSAKGDRPIHENAMVAIPEGRSLPIFHGSKTGTRRQSSDQESHVKASQSYGCRTVSR
jgi:hypothetical protein